MIFHYVEVLKFVPFTESIQYYIAIVFIKLKGGLILSRNNIRQRSFSVHNIAILLEKLVDKNK